ncbi:hypothetical protein ACSMXM_15190 [Pacificimonas sp. ICDLI1SI03]
MDIQSEDARVATADAFDEMTMPTIIAESVGAPKTLRKRPIRTKKKEEVEFVLEDGTNLTGFIFLSLDERVLDCLNDSRPFFPFLTEDGEMLLLAKNRIAVCRPLS